MLSRTLSPSVIRKKPAQTDLVFGPVQRELLNTVLSEIGLKRDRDGRLRTAYSLRHTYICMRLMEGGGHLSNRQELSDERGDDREILRRAYQEHLGCRSNKRAEGTTEEGRFLVDARADAQA